MPSYHSEVFRSPGPDQPAQGHEMPDAHQRVSKNLRVHCTYFTVVHSLGQTTNISLADLVVVVEEGIWRDSFRLLNDAINAPMFRHKGEERLKTAFLYL